MENEEGIKKVKFYDALLLISFITPIIVIGSIYILPDFIGGLMILLGLLISISSILVFYLCMLFWMAKENRYFLFIVSLIIWLPPLVYYFTILRKKFNEGKF